MVKKVKSINEVMQDHKKWLEGKKNGIRLTSKVIKDNRINLRAVFLNKFTFEKANIPRTDFSFSNMAGVNFKGANLHGSSFSNVDALEANFSHANLKNSSLSGRLTGVDLSYANVVGASIDPTTLYNGNLVGTKAKGTRIEKMVGFSEKDNKRVKELLAKNGSKYVLRAFKNLHDNLNNGNTDYVLQKVEEVYKELENGKK